MEKNYWEQQWSKQTAYLLGGLVGVLILVGACGPAGPTPEPTRTRVPEIAASPTIDPLVPTVDNSAAVGRNSPDTAAAPNDMDITPPALPFAVDEPFEVSASSDGLELRGTLYRPDTVDSTPAVLLLHMLNGRQDDWLPLVTPLQQAGYTVLALDMRGHGLTGGTADWTLAGQDVADVMAALRATPGVDAQRTGIIGASIGANLTIQQCAADDLCRGAVALSPGLDYRGVQTEPAVVAFGEQPLLILVSPGDSYSATSSAQLAAANAAVVELRQLAGNAHGTRLFADYPALPAEIITWLADTLG